MFENPAIAGQASVKPPEASGDGNGVMSAKGPRPGDDTAEAGDRDPPV